jgi:prevent-host-death family protein
VRQVNVSEARAQLSQLLRAVEAGEEIVIARAGKPVARIVAHDAEQPTRPGSRFGRKLAEDVDEEDIELARDFGILE